jgi:UDP:flavonoid glycosyltransferase YjiC (YdhE family)
LKLSNLVKQLSKILICTRGSLGDVLPYIALAHGLQKNGHQVLMVVNASNLGVVKKQGIECVAFDVGQAADKQNSKDFKGLTQSLLGSLKVLRKLGKHLREEVACIQRLAPSFDLIMGSQTSLAAPLVARALGKPWVFSGVSPMAFMSFIDPPYLHGLRWLGKDSVLPNWWKAVLRWFFLKLSDVIYVDYRQIEQELGLPHQHPLFSGRYSPWLNLALFSPLLAEPQSDWPENTVQCGFVEEDKAFEGSQCDPKLLDFLSKGTPPVVFTLGSAARLDPGDFYEIAIKVVAKLGLRAVLVKRADLDLPVDISLPVYVCHSAHYPSLFKASQAVVHHGGVATLTLAMRTGKPSLILPRTLDQFDQAARAQRLGMANVLPFHKLTELRLMECVHSLTALRVNVFQADDGIEKSCFALEKLLERIRYEIELFSA